MKSLNSRVRALMVAVFVFVFNSLLAQKNVGDAFATANEQLKSTVNGALTTFQYICGLGALVGGCMLFYKGEEIDSIKKEQESNEAKLVSLYNLRKKENK